MYIYIYIYIYKHFSTLCPLLYVYIQALIFTMSYIFRMSTWKVALMGVGQMGTVKPISFLSVPMVKVSITL